MKNRSIRGKIDTKLTRLEGTDNEMKNETKPEMIEMENGNRNCLEDLVALVLSHFSDIPTILVWNLIIFIGTAKF